MKFTYALLLMLMSGTLFLSSCGDDEVDPNEDLNNRLEGEWDVQSFFLKGAFSFEAIGNGFQSVTLEFEKQGPDDGEYEITYIYTNGTTDTEEGDYEIENDGTEISLMPRNSSADDEEYDIEIDGDDLEMEGRFDLPIDGVVTSTLVEIEAERD